MATYTQSYGSKKASSTGVFTGDSTILYNYEIPTTIPPFSTIISITPSFTHSAEKGALTIGSLTKSATFKKATSSNSFSLYSGSSIQDTDVLTSGTLENYYNLINFNFFADVPDTSYISKHEVSNFSLKYEYTPFEHDITFKIKTGNIITDYEPTINNLYLTGFLNEDRNTATVSVTGAPDGYHFAGWQDQIDAGLPIESTRIIAVDADYTYTAVFDPVPYTVNYYDLTSGQEVLFHSQSCLYGNNYSHPALPTASSKTGYRVNPSGWTAEKQNYVRNNEQKIYNKAGTKEIEQISGRFSNLTLTANATINYYFNYHPIQYSITYIKYAQGSLNNYTSSTVYRNYGEGDYFLASLPSATKGYKLTNKMLEENGPIDTSITSSWFESSEHMNPGDSKTNYIDSECLEDVRIYSFETPIDYTINFIVMLENNIENSEIINCKYDKSVTYSISPVEIEGYEWRGWYRTSQENENWYIDLDGNLNGGEDKNSTYFSGLNLTSSDQVQIEIFSYYIPKSYSVEYQWLDEYEGTILPPEKQIRIYNKENIIVQTIPTSEYFDIENEGTIKWYYYKNNDITTERLTNAQTEISSSDTTNYVFYAIRYPIGSNIGFSSNDEDFGSVVIMNQKVDNMYENGDIIKVYVSPTDIAYFSHWSDGNNQPYREIVAGEVHKHYEAIFRSNQVMGVRSILLGDNTPVKAIYKGTTPVYKE